ncbi:MAG: alpha/beta fold hydrolase [Ilumatobacteraceae bacterium]|nr:alpha/beta fold hydrolase [Ilumatobacteraceae bacterium]
MFLHGFTQTHHHWHPVAHRIVEALDTTPTRLFVDLPGHGLAADDATPIADAGEPLAALAGRGTYLGYSMGGRFALMAALARPNLVERLVLIGATPGIDDETERAERRALDDERAARIERDGVDAFLDAWLAAPMFAGLPADPDGLAHRRRNTAAGLARSLRTAGTGSQPSVWERLGEITAPVLVIAGEHDTKFTDIGRRMTECLPDAEFVSVAGAGHAAHIEQPEQTARLIADRL